MYVPKGLAQPPPVLQWPAVLPPQAPLAQQQLEHTQISAQKSASFSRYQVKLRCATLVWHFQPCWHWATAH